jgi:hypothetical protein
MRRDQYPERLYERRSAFDALSGVPRSFLDHTVDPLDHRAFADPGNIVLPSVTREADLHATSCCGSSTAGVSVSDATQQSLCVGGGSKEVGCLHFPYEGQSPGPEERSNLERAEVSGRRMPAGHVIEVYDLLKGMKSTFGLTCAAGGTHERAWRLRHCDSGQRPPKMRALLDERGYQDKGEEHARPWDFALRDQTGHEINVHAINLDGAGNGIYGPPENGERYPASSLRGTGVIAGRLVQMHLGGRCSQVSLRI